MPLLNSENDDQQTLNIAQGPILHNLPMTSPSGIGSISLFSDAERRKQATGHWSVLHKISVFTAYHILLYFPMMMLSNIKGPGQNRNTQPAFCPVRPAKRLVQVFLIRWMVRGLGAARPIFSLILYELRVV